MKLKTFFSGFVLGGLTAGIGTLLTVPSSGRETRQKIKETNDHLREELFLLKDNINELKNATVDATKEGKKQITIFIKELKGSLSSWEENVRPAQENLKKELKELRQSVEELEHLFNEDQNN